MNNIVIEKIKNSPDKTGVYLYKDIYLNIIYVGKAKNLRKRLLNYLTYKNSENIKYKNLYANIEDLDFVITGNELEALTLESSYIKRYSPKYNVQLKDDKNYPYIRIDTNEEWPFIDIVRKIKNDGALYFGPYTKFLKNFLFIINRISILRRCRKVKKNKKPCLNYHIKNCLAPCCGDIDEVLYKENLNLIIDFLKGRITKVFNILKADMEKASELCNFEEAIKIKESISAIEYFKKNNFSSTSLKDSDFIKFKNLEDVLILNLISIRNGVMQSSINFEIDKINIVEGETSLLSTFLVNYYEKRPLPSNIYTNFKDSDFKLFSESRKIKVFFDIKEDISNILDDNLKCLEEEINKKNSDWDAFNKAISSFLKTDKNYITVECYDASNIGGSVTVGAKVAFNKAKSDKSLYRKYVLKDYKGDDLLAISEVLKRRIKSEDTLPDIIIIDGGKTQLNVAFDILRNKNVLLLSIAKGRDVLEDKVYIIKDDKICNLKIDNLNYIKKLRDEVHRFVIKFHREKREKNFLTKNLKKSI